MATAPTFTEPIPDRRRTRFARNGGPRPTPAERRLAKRGLAAAREVLEATDPGAPRHSVIQPLPTPQVERARRGIEAARRALSA